MAGSSGTESVLEAELSCPVCLSTYRDPVTLGCAHCFCRECITQVLSHQREQGRAYTCPMCQAQYEDLPTLTKNLQLSSIVASYVSVQRSPEVCPQIPCDDCLEQPHIAVKRCVSCEVALCPKHVQRHQKRGHMLLEPTASVQERKCSDHDKLLEYVCQKDGSIICVTCYIAGSHKGHDIMTMKEAHEKHQATLSETTSTLSASVTSFCKDIQDLKAGLEKVTENTERLCKPLEDLRERIINQVNDQFKEINQEILTNQEQETTKITALIKQMEEAKEGTEEVLEKIKLISKQTDDLLFVKDFNRAQAMITQTRPHIDTMQVLDVEADTTMIENVDQETTDYITSIRKDLACMRQELPQQIQQLVWSGTKRVKEPLLRRLLPTKVRKSEKINLQFVQQNYQHCSYMITVSNQFKTLSAETVKEQKRSRAQSSSSCVAEPCKCKLPVIIPDYITRGFSDKVHCLVDVSTSNDWSVGIKNYAGVIRYLRLKDRKLSYESDFSLSLGYANINTLKIQLDYGKRILSFYDVGEETEIPILIYMCDDVFIPPTDDYAEGYDGRDDEEYDGHADEEYDDYAEEYEAFLYEDCDGLYDEPITVGFNICQGSLTLL